MVFSNEDLSDWSHSIVRAVICLEDMMEGANKECTENFCGETSSNKIPVGRTKRWEGNIKTYLRESGCEDGKWMELSEGRVQQ
jgi:hypothetical protein